MLTALSQLLATAYLDNNKPGCMATSTNTNCSNREKLRAKYKPAAHVRHNDIASTMVC